MKHLLATLLLATLCAFSGYGQTIKTLGFNSTNGQVIANTGTNSLSFSNLVIDDTQYKFGEISRGGAAIDLEEQRFVGAWEFESAIGFETPTTASTTRTNLGLGATWLTNTNVTNFRTAIGLGTTNDVTFSGGTFNGQVTFNEDVYGSYFETISSTNGVQFSGSGIVFLGSAAATTRTNLGLGATWLTNNNVTNFRTAIGLGAANNVSFDTVSANEFSTDNGISGASLGPDGILFAGTAATTTRTNLGLPLPALTNTSNVTFLSAVGAAQTIFSVRTNDLSITNQTNATSTGLSFDTQPNARYVVTLYPIVNGNTEVQMVASNATIFGQWNGYGTGFASATELTNARALGAGSDNRGALQVFYVEGGTNAGSISVTFRSTVATNTNTIKAGSFIRADRMP